MDDDLPRAGDVSEHDQQMRAFYEAELPDRLTYPLSPERVALATTFAALCHERGLRSVLEVGCGAGRDGLLLSSAGLRYTGVDLSPVGVRLCLDQGLAAHEASAVQLPFADDSFDAAWTMSTLMHLPGDDIVRAVAELARVVRPGGVLEVGVWGAEVSGVDIQEDLRYFRLRTDAEVREILGSVGRVETFARGMLSPSGYHYQWARVIVPGRHAPTDVSLISSPRVADGP